MAICWTMWWNSRTWISFFLPFSNSPTPTRSCSSTKTADKRQPRQKTILRFESRHELHSRKGHCPSRSKRRERTAAVGRIGKLLLVALFTCGFHTLSSLGQTGQTRQGTAHWFRLCKEDWRRRAVDDILRIVCLCAPWSAEQWAVPTNAGRLLEHGWGWTRFLLRGKMTLN